MSWQAGQIWGQSVPGTMPPNMMNMSSCTPEQWAAMQQQNWQQWQQWQQQYAQWQNQYGEKYSEQMKVMQGVGAPPLPNQLPVPAPPPPEQPPPPPHENNQPLYGHTTLQPPAPVPSVPPSMLPQSTGNNQNNYLIPASNWNQNQSQAKWNQNENPWSGKSAQNAAGYDNSAKGNVFNAQNIPGPNAAYNAQNNIPGNYNQPQQNINKPQQNRNNNAKQIQAPLANLEALKKLSEEERSFDDQFRKWEDEFDKWKQANVDHPDKKAYSEYEKQFEACRVQLLERRQQMKLKRAKLMNTTPNLGGTPQKDDPTAAGKNISSVPPRQVEPVKQQGNVPQRRAENSFPRQQGNALAQGHNVLQKNQNPAEQRHQLTGQPELYQISGNLKSVPNSDKPYDTYSAQYEQYNDDSKSKFLPSTVGRKGIPGLDLVENDPSKTKQKLEVIDITEEPQRRQNDFTAISKGIDNILGDQKILNILSMVKNTAPPGINQAQFGQNVGPNNAGNWHNTDDNINYPRDQQRNEGFQGRPYVQQGPNNSRGPPPLMNQSIVRPVMPPHQFMDRNISQSPQGKPMQQRVFDPIYNTGMQQNDGILQGSNRNMEIQKLGVGPKRDSIGMQQQDFGQNRNIQQNLAPNQNQAMGPNMSRQNMPGRPSMADQARGIPQDNFGRPDIGGPQNKPNLDFGRPDIGGPQNKPNLSPNMARPNMYGQDMAITGHIRPSQGAGMNYGVGQNQSMNRGVVPNQAMNRGVGPNQGMSSRVGPNQGLHRGLDPNQGMNSGVGSNQGMPGMDISPALPPPQPEVKWLKEPILEPYIIVDYEHKPLRMKVRDFIEPVQTFDYNHITKDKEYRKDETSRMNELKMFHERSGTKVIDYHNQKPDKPVEVEVSDKRYDGDRFRNRYERDYSRRDDRSDRRRDDRLDDRGRYDRQDDRSRNDRLDDRRRDDRLDDRGRNDRLDDRRNDRNIRHSRRSPLPERRRDDKPQDSRARERSRDRERRNDRSRDRSKDSRRERSRSREKSAGTITSKTSKPDVKSSQIVMIDDLLEPPGRDIRPEKIIIILRGPPGSGKTYLAKLIRDREVENGGSAPRILSIDDYFMQETEVEEKDPTTGRMVKKMGLKYDYDERMEDNYLNSLKRAFKRHVTDGYFPFIIVDAVNDQLKSYAEMWNFGRQSGFQVYIVTMDLDPQMCYKRNVHNRKLEDIEVIVSRFFPTPSHHITLDATTLLQNAAITEVHMEDVNSDDDVVIMEDAMEPEVTESSFISKWEKMDDAIQLARLDGTSKPLRSSQLSLDEYLQLDDWQPARTSKPGKKTVRWADIEERRKQDKMRAIGFVVGQTDWNRMTDPTQGSSALTQTKYIERVRRY